MSKRDLKAIIPGCIVAVLILCYFGIAFYFDQVFCPNTSINGMDVSYMKPEDVRAALEDVPRIMHFRLQRLMVIRRLLMESLLNLPVSMLRWKN